MKMLFTAFAVVALSASVFGQRNRDPCEGAAFEFMNDYASCESYFWCRPAAQGGTTPTAPCGDGLSFNQALQVCDMDSLITCTPCPAILPHEPFAVAIGTDTTCKSYDFCVNGMRTENVQQCGPGTLFNRVTGMCDLEANVRCYGGGSVDNPLTPCTVDGAPYTGDVNSDSSCAAFYQCIGGEATPPIPLKCSQGLHFNPATKRCALPADLTPPCVDPAQLPAVLAVVKQDHSPEPTFRDRVMSRLHLKL